MQPVINNQNSKPVRYVPEHSMGTRKFRTRTRKVPTFILTEKQRERRLTGLAR